MRLFNPESAHWYQRDGVPMHTVRSAKGEERATTLRDARKLGLLPSVTNVLGVIAKPELDLWKQEQAVLAALTLPRRREDYAEWVARADVWPDSSLDHVLGWAYAHPPQDMESPDDFAKRVVADSQTTRSGAADFGTAFHHGAERVARTLEVDPEDPVAPWLRLYREWFQANCVRLVWAERSLAAPELGFAGTADLLMDHQAHGLTLVDLKTQGMRRRGPRGEGRGAGQSSVISDRSSEGVWEHKAYKSWCYQLAAYRRALGQPVACLNLIINSREPAEPVEHRWGEEEIQRGWIAFQAAQTLWSIEKGYDPRGQGDHRTTDHRQAERTRLAA